TLVPSIFETSSWVRGLIAVSLCIGAVVAPGAGRAGLFGEVDVWAEAAPVIRASAATAIGSLRMEGSNAGEALLPTRPFRGRSAAAKVILHTVTTTLRNVTSGAGASGLLFFQIPRRADIVARPGVEYFRLNIFDKNWRRTDALSLATVKPARSVAAQRARRR